MNARAELTDAVLRQMLPGIPWDKPLPVETPDAKGIACRYCIARFGLRGGDVPQLPQTLDEWKQHMREHHETKAS